MLICVLPYSTATCERNFSALKIVKTRLRSALGDDHIDNLLALYIEMDLMRVFGRPSHVGASRDAFQGHGIEQAAEKHLVAMDSII